MSLSAEDIERFVQDGYVRVSDAFSQDVAAQCRGIIDEAAGVRWNEPSTWREPVVRLGHFSDPPFLDAANTPILREACTQLVGRDRWAPLSALGTFVLRFPVPGSINDDGWHIDVSFAGPDSVPDDYMTWRANVWSRDRGLLMLFLLTDIEETDGPTRLRVGSHLSMARRLQPAGDAGLSLAQLAEQGFDDTAECLEVLATGKAGTVYLCHPFVVHAAQRNIGKHARYLAQPSLSLRQQLSLHRADGIYTPVERAIRLGLGSR